MLDIADTASGWRDMTDMNYDRVTAGLAAYKGEKIYAFGSVSKFHSKNHGYSNDKYRNGHQFNSL